MELLSEDDESEDSLVHEESPGSICVVFFFDERFFFFFLGLSELELSDGGGELLLFFIPTSLSTPSVNG